MASPRYTRNINPEDLKPDAPVILTKQQKLQNFWYYHKWHLLLGVLGVILVICVIVSIASVVSPDYQITLLSPVTRSSLALEELQELLTPYGKDLNGDGKVIVQVQQYILATREEDLETINPQINMAGNAQLQGDAQIGGTVIFITDDFEALQKKQGFFADLDHLYAPYDPAKTDGTYFIPWEDCKVLNQLDFSKETSMDSIDQLNTEEEFAGTVLCMRTIGGTTLEEDAHFQEYYKESAELFSVLTGYPAA